MFLNVGRRSREFSIAEHAIYKGHPPLPNIAISLSLLFPGMASPINTLEYDTITKGAEAMRTNYSFIWQHSKLSQELQSKLVEKLFMTEADREEVNSYGQRFAQNAVIIHRVLFSDKSPISLHEVLKNTGQGHITNKLMQGT